MGNSILAGGDAFAHPNEGEENSSRRGRGLGLGRARKALGPFVGPNFSWMLGGIAVLGAIIGLTEAAILRIIGELVGAIESSSGADGLVDAGGSDSARQFDMAFLGSVGVGQLVAVGIGATVLLVLLRVLETGGIAKIGVLPLSESRNQLARAFLGASFESQQGVTAGEFQEYVTAHTMRLGSIATATATLVSATLVAVALAVVAAWVSLPALVVLSVVMLAVLGLTIPIHRLAHRLGKREAEANTTLANRTAEMVRAATDARVFGVSDSLKEVNQAQVGSVSNLIFWNRAVTFFGSSLFQALMLGVIVVVGGWMAGRSTGDFASAGTVALIALRAQMAGRRALTANLSIATSAPFADELHRTIGTLHASAGSSGNSVLGRLDEVELRGLGFAHGNESVLAGLDLRVGRGEHVGIVGASGSGKSTLLSILLGLRAPQTGEFLLNGNDRSAFTAESISSQIAGVSQRPNLITGTVTQNIAFFRDLSDDAVIRAARAAGIEDEIRSWPDGFETVIGERAVRQVSGGQAQRICIARALAGDPSLLIMDEPTSAIDDAGTELIADTMSALEDHCGAIIVSHRIEALRSCDRVLTLENGRLRE